MKKLFEVILLLAVLAGLYFLYTQNKSGTVDDQKEKVAEISGPIFITLEEIQEENFTGSRPVIAGEGLLAQTVREHIANTIQEFKTQADKDVPQMREDFGPDSPPATYTIEIQAEQIESEETSSIIIGEYVYTGGAHGSSTYKVFTSSKQSGELLSLSDIIKEEQQKEFTKLIKEKLLKWSPDQSMPAPVVFEDEIASLTFTSLTNWALDNDNLIFYFSQYEVGPGALGAFPFPVSLAEISNMLK